MTSLSVYGGGHTKDDDIQIGEVTITGKLKEVEMKGDTTVINAAAINSRRFLSGGSGETCSGIGV